MIKLVLEWIRKIIFTPSVWVCVCVCVYVRARTCVFLWVCVYRKWLFLLSNNLSAGTYTYKLNTHGRFSRAYSFTNIHLHNIKKDIHRYKPTLKDRNSHKNYYIYIYIYIVGFIHVRRTHLLLLEYPVYFRLIIIFIYIYIYIYIYAPPWGLSTLAKELSAAARIMQSSYKELSTLVADRV